MSSELFARRRSAPGISTPSTEVLARAVNGRPRTRSSRLLRQLVRLRHDAAAETVRADALAAEQPRLLDQVRQVQAAATIGHLAAGIAHEFNNALSVVLASAQLLLESVAPDDPRRPDVEDVQAGADRAVDLSRRLLAIGRGPGSGRRTRVALNRVVADVARLLGPVLGKGTKLSLVLAPELGTIEADVGELEQSIVDLVIRARDAVPEGGVVALTTENVERSAAHDPGTEPGAQVVLTVLGEPGGSVSRLFFRNVSAKTADVKTGVKTVLVVDDQPSVRNVIAKGLRRQGYEVLVAQDRAETVRVLAEHAGAVDLVLSDWRFPEHTGMDVLTAVRARFPEARVIFASGDACPVPSLPFLAKPFGIADLVATVQDAFSNGAAPANARPVGSVK